MPSMASLLGWFRDLLRPGHGRFRRHILRTPGIMASESSLQYPLDQRCQALGKALGLPCIHVVRWGICLCRG